MSVEKDLHVQLQSDDTDQDQFKQTQAQIDTNIVLMACLILIMIFDVIVFIRAKVYQRFSPSFIIFVLFSLALVRALEFAYKTVHADKAYYMNFLFNRLMTDIPTYFLGIISMMLFFQWN